jgi:hypothetical protein
MGHPLGENMDVQEIINESIKMKIATILQCSDEDVVTIVLEQKIETYHRKHGSAGVWEKMKPLQGNLSTN